MKYYKKMMNNNKQGITLIALIITIIVLLILAGISISMLSGDNSILQKTTEAKEITDIGREKEDISLVYTSLIGKELLDGEKITDLSFEEELNKNGDNAIVGYDNENNYLVYFNDTKRTYKVDKDGNTITELENAPELITETIYATLYSDGTLAFSSNSDTDNSKTVTKKYTIGMNDIFTNADMVPWKNEQSSINKVIFVSDIIPTSTAHWFRNCVNLNTIENIEKLKTNRVTDMTAMFCGCRKLTALNLETFDTRKVTKMRNMFNSWSDDGSGFGNGNALTSLNLNSFDTSNVTDMASMFNGCSKLASLNLNSFNTSNVTNMFGMFAKCSNLTSLDLSNFNTCNVSEIGEIYQGMASMFQDCSGLTSLNLSSFDTSRVTDMSSMFNGCSSLTNIDLSSFNTINVINMQYMFCNCASLTSLDLSNFDTNNVTTMESMFAAGNGYYMKMETIDLSGKFGTANVQNTRLMFSLCNKLKTIYTTENFVTNKITDSYAMFNQCYLITGGSGTTFNSNKIDKEYARIDGGTTSSTPGYLTYKFNQ